MNWLILALGLGAIALTDLRWFRVAQREHYIAGSASRFASRWWWSSGALNRILLVIAIVAFVCASVVPAMNAVTAVVLCLGPIGLSLSGKTSKLVTTSRMKAVIAVTCSIQLLAVLLLALIAGLHGAAFGSVVMALVAPSIIDLVLRGLEPWEMRKLRPFVESASQRLQSVSPRVVAVTGSYGKTTTKNYLAALLGQLGTVVATPASFNNRAGLSRAINENLTPGTDVFIAEMGTYGRGEIKELCEFCPPDISVLTAIGPVHLERFKTEEEIIRAKSEIFAKPSVCVVNVDDERLEIVAEKLVEEGKRVWRCSTEDIEADVCVRTTDEGLEVFAGGSQLFEPGESDAVPGNLAVAIAVAFELGMSVEQIAEGLKALPKVPHRSEMQQGPNGQTVIDDTFNANPASVRRSLELMAQANAQDAEAKRVLVTPGMVELGHRQDAENFAFGRDACSVANKVIVVGKTNKSALVAGVREGGQEAMTVKTLADAVSWVRENTAQGDVVAYINDLPDHFP